MSVFGITTGQPNLHRVGHGFSTEESPMTQHSHETDRDQGPTSWLVAMRKEGAEIREMLQEEVAEAAEHAHTASGRREAMSFLGRMYQHSVTNHHIADRASEAGDVELTIVVGEMQQIIDAVVMRLEEILATTPASTRTRREGAHQPVVEL